MSAACRGRPICSTWCRRRNRAEPSTRSAYATRLRGAVADIVRKQVELGIDIVDDGEYGKPSFVSYVNERLGGFEVDKELPRQSPWAGSREDASFPEFYARRPRRPRASNHMVCTGPVTYRGKAQLAARHRQPQGGGRRRQAAAKRSCRRSRRRASRTGSATPTTRPTRNIVFAVAEAMREEYEAIVDAGLPAADRRSASS